MFPPTMNRPGLRGLGATAPQQPANGCGYIERPHIYVFEYDDIPGDGTVTGLFQLIDNDSDFYWRAITGSSTNNGFFGARFQDANGYYLSTDFVSGFVFSSAYVYSPFPYIPAILCPAGSKITIDLQDQSGSTNSILLNFIGVKRYYL